MPVTATITTGAPPSGTATTIADSGAKDSVPYMIAHDPMVIQLTWVVAVITLVFGIGKPIRDYLKSEKREAKVDVVTDAKSDAETVLYNHLSDQINQYRKVADEAFKDRTNLIMRVAALEAKTEDLAEQKALVEKLKIRLDKKDEEIQLLLSQAADERKQFLAILQSKENEIAKRDERILILEQRTQELEIRLMKGESTINAFTCPMVGGHRKTDIPLGPLTDTHQEGKEQA